MYNLGQHFVIQPNNLKAKADVTFSGSKFRITILTERLVRIEYSEVGKFSDDASQLVINRVFDKPEFEVKQDNLFLEIKTEYFSLTYSKNSPLKGTAMNTMKNLRIQVNGTENIWYYGHPEVRNYYGCNATLDGFNKKEPINKGLYSIEGFVSLDDSNSLRFDYDGTVKPQEPDNTSYTDVYVFVYGKDFGYCIQDYFKLTGMPAFIPRYALGNWWCRNLPYTQDEIIKLADTFTEHDMPLSVMLLDKDWHFRQKPVVEEVVNTETQQEVTGENTEVQQPVATLTSQDIKVKEQGLVTNISEQLYETGYTFNTDLIPNPKRMVEELHQRGIRVGLNTNPKDGIRDYEFFFEEIKKYLTPNEQGIIPFTPYDPKFIDVYLKLLIHPLEGLGIDFFWNDYSTDTKDMHATWLLNHYLYKDLARIPEKRGMVLGRSGMIAAHKYPVLYSGKTKVSWDNFKTIPFFNLSASNIGVCWWSHDIGGYNDGIEDSELYIRSVELGTFSPIMRFHSDKGKYYKREPWRWDKKTFEVVDDYLRLRHELIPYLYTEAYEYYDKGLMIFQPLYYLYPKFYDSETYRNEYFFGRQLFVTPILNKKDLVMNRTIHHFFLPDGVWYDFFTGQKYIGKHKYIAFYKEEDYPVFAKAGAIIPLSKKSNINNTSAPTDLEIQVFAGENNTYTLYEDDGISSLYKEGYFLKTEISYNYMPSNYTVIVRSVEGKSGIIPDKRNYIIRFRNTKQTETVSAYFNETKIEATSRVENNDFVVEVKDVPTVGQLTISVKGDDIEMNAVHVMQDDIDDILNHLQIQTRLKEEIAKIIFSTDETRIKRINLTKLKKKGLDKSFITLFKKLLEYMEQI